MSLTFEIMIESKFFGNGGMSTVAMATIYHIIPTFWWFLCVPWPSKPMFTYKFCGTMTHSFEIMIEN